MPVRNKQKKTKKVNGYHHNLYCCKVELPQQIRGSWNEILSLTNSRILGTKLFKLFMNRCWSMDLLLPFSFHTATNHHRRRYTTSCSGEQPRSNRFLKPKTAPKQKSFVRQNAKKSKHRHTKPDACGGKYNDRLPIL